MSIEILFSIIALSYFAISSYWLLRVRPSSLASDPVKQVRAIQNFGKWLLPANMHHFSERKTTLKETALYLTIVVTKIFRLTPSYSAILIMCNLCHTLSSVLLFVTLQDLVSTPLSFAFSAIYLVSVWANMVVLQAGFQIVAQLFFLVFLMALKAGNLWLAGVSSGLVFFSSASARKFYPGMILLFIASHVQFQIDQLQIRNSPVLLTVVLAFTILCLGTISLRKQIISLIYKRLLSFLLAKKIIQNVHPETYYQLKLGNLILFCTQCASFMTLLLAGGLVVEDLSVYLQNALIFAGTASFIFFFFMIPNFKVNLFELAEFYSPVATGHFPVFQDVLKSMGVSLISSLRTTKSGWRLIFKMLMRLVPLEIGILAFLYGTLSYFYLTAGLQMQWLNITAVSVAAFLPVIWGELTKGPQIARSYFPVFIFLYLLMGYLTFKVSVHHLIPQLEALLVLVLALGSLRNIFLLVVNIYPSRLSEYRLTQFVRKNKIQSLATYNNGFSSAFLEIIRKEIPDLKIESMKSIDEPHPWKLIPPTSAKSVVFESSSTISKAGDFQLDEKLNEIIESKAIRDKAFLKVMSPGCSQYWALDSEVTALRSLMLGDIGQKDYFRGFGWIIKN